MKALLAPLAELADYEEIRKNRTKGRRQRVTQLDLLDLEIGTALEPHARVSGSGIADRIGMRV